MKDLMMAVGCACALAWAGGGLRAEEAKVEPEKPRKSKPAPKPRKPVLRGMQAEMAKVCELSDEQIKQIDSVNAKRNKALAAHRKDNAEKIKAAAEAMKKAREAKDKEATKKAYEAQAAIRAEQSGIVEKFDRQVMDVLTDEQKQLWAAHEMARYLKRRYPKFEFTDDQIAKAIAAQKAAEADVPAGDAKAAAKARRALDEKIREDVLTGEQRATLAMRYVLGRYRAIKLTDEQKAKIKAAYVELAEGKDLTDRKVAAQFDRDLRVKVHSDVLTPAQRATLAVGPILGRYRAAKITDEQRIEIEAAYVKLAEGKDATDSKVRQQLQKDLRRRSRRASSARTRSWPWPSPASSAATAAPSSPTSRSPRSRARTSRPCPG